MNIIEKAIGFAVKAHAGTLRKGTNLPYILHPMEAASIAAQLTDDQEIIAATVLHDTIEDTETSAEDIRKEFGARVAALVSSNTENKRRELPAADTWLIRKQETIEHLKTASRAVKIVVFADKLSNLRAMVKDYTSEGEMFWNRFEMKDPHKHVWYYGAMIEPFEELGDSLLHREYLRLYRMLRMEVQEYDDFGRHNKNALEVIAPPNNGYWVLRMKKSDDMMLMTEEEFQEFIRNHSGE